MKKIVLMALAVATAVAVQADLRQYTIFGVGGSPAPIVIGNDGVADGAFPSAPADGSNALAEYGWINLTTDVETIAPAGGGAGWFGALGGYVVGGFAVTDQETQSIAVRYYNEAKSYFIDSQPIVLPDLTDPIAPGADELGVDFSGQNWVAVPEPATIGLMGIAGLGLYLSRRKRR